MKYILILMVIGFLNFSYAQKNDELNGIIKNLLLEQKLSGATWSIVSDNGEIITDAAGLKNIKTKELLHANDKVHVGSVCKTILAAGFLRMATLELLDLDDPISKYLPNLPIDYQLYQKNSVTIRHLLDHTSGLTDAKLWHIFSTTSTPNTPLEEVYLRTPNILKVHAKPGSMYSYSNLGYTILGMIIEKITNERYEDYLDKNILMPLGMTKSSFHFISQKTDITLAFGHFDNGQPIEAMPMYLRPAGQFTTKAEDMGKFLRFMISDGTIDGKSFINEKYLKGVGQQKLTEANKNGVLNGDAFGAYSRDRYGVVGIAKNGNTLGFSSMIYMFPAYKKAFFIAYNMDSETANYDLFNEAIVKHLGLATNNFIATGKEIPQEMKNWNGYFVPVITKVEPFGLLDMVFSHTKVETTKTGARILPFQGKEKSLIYQGGSLFSMKSRIANTHTFYKKENGEMLISDGISTIKKVSGYKIFMIAASLFLGLISMLALFIAGIVQIIRYKLDFIKSPQIWIFIAVLSLVISIIFIINQPFMKMGDLTFANGLLSASTTLIPIFSLISLMLILKNQKSYFKTFSFWATLFVLQFCLLLMANNLMPIVMWR
jgi:CubicO group peptidase (beta-lactamase class C family)